MLNISSVAHRAWFRNQESSSFTFKAEFLAAMFMDFNERGLLLDLDKMVRAPD
jgi:hypothetical protein